MNASEHEQLVLTPVPGYEPEIGRMLWMLEDTRLNTLEKVSGLDQQLIDWNESPGSNSIGTLLYHIAVIEMDWIYVEVREQEFPTEIIELFPYDVRDESGRLTVVAGLSLEEHIDRLSSMRKHLLHTFEQMNLEDFRRMRNLSDYDVSPEWVLYHLIEHEVEHRGEIGVVYDLAERALGRY